MSEKINPGAITFKPMTLLRLDGAPIEALDHSPLYLRDLVIDTTDTINRQMDRIYQRDIEKANNPESVKRTHIFIARLALRDEVSLRQVLTYSGRQDLNSIHTDPSHFTTTPREHFEELRDTTFAPQIRIRGEAGPEELQGVWLSLVTKPKAQ